MNALLYLTIILLWGFTWYAIKIQVGMVPIEISLIYRFTLAAIIMFFIALWKKAPLKFSLKQHGAMMLLGALMFCINFLFIYRSAGYLTSGINAIVFSTSVIMIMLNSIIFLRKPISANMVFGSLLGLSGLALIFWQELEDFDLTDNTFHGLVLALLATYSFAWANHATTICSRLSIPTLSSTFYGMVYGVILLNIACLVLGIDYAFESTFPYIFSLLYLVIPGSIFGFLIYFALVQRLGTVKAAYTTLFFPIVALIVSTYVESYEWVKEAIFGVGLIIVGNALVLTPPEVIKNWFVKKI